MKEEDINKIINDFGLNDAGAKEVIKKVLEIRNNELIQRLRKFSTVACNDLADLIEEGKL